MSYELSGTVKVIQQPQTFASGFSKRELVVTVQDGNYPQDINLEFVKDKADLLDSLSVGDSVKVWFDIRGREHNGRYYNNLSAWKVENLSGSAPSAPAGQQPPAFDDDLDDVPF
jgi:hypothetical protein